MFAENKSCFNILNVHVSSLLFSSLRVIVICRKYSEIMWYRLKSIFLHHYLTWGVVLREMWRPVFNLHFCDFNCTYWISPLNAYGGRHTHHYICFLVFRLHINNINELDKKKLECFRSTDRPKLLAPIPNLFISLLSEHYAKQKLYVFCHIAEKLYGRSVEIFPMIFISFFRIAMHHNAAKSEKQIMFLKESLTRSSTVIFTSRRAQK